MDEAALSEKVSQVNMLSNIVQSLRVWARRLWRRRIRSAEKKANSYPSSEPQGPKSAGATDSDQCGQVPTEIEPVTPGSAGSEKTPSDPPEDALPEPDLPSAQPAEDHGNAPNSNADVGGSSQSDLTDSPPEPPEDNACDKNSDSPEDKSQKPPRRIGGRRNGPTQSLSPVDDDAKDEPTFTPQPELICRKSRNGEYSLSSLAGSLSIDHEDRESDQLPLFDGTPLIFKMPNDWKGEGHKVGGITSGHFIVMAPREWKRTGSAPVEPEECTDANFMAHFFYVKKGESEGNVGGFEGYDRALTRTGFELCGDSVFDDSEDGELFVGAPPKLRPASGVVWARIGEEKEGGWKGENFKPAEQSLADVLNSRQGRFFVRVYDDSAELLDSGEFRYLRDLWEIRVNGEPYSANTLFVPSSAGYSPAEVQFVSTDGTAIHPNLDTAGTHVTMQSGGILIVAPHPDGDHISCALPSGEDRVDTVIKLPRIWWRMEQDDGEADEWRDMPLAMTRQQFRDLGCADAAIRLLLPLRVSSVKVGFDEELDRTYCPQKETEIRLSDFIDYDQISQRLNEDSSLSIRCGEAVLPLIRVSADPTVRSRSQTGIDKSAIKKQIKALKVKREAALQARDKKCLKEVRRQIRRLKRKIRKSTSDLPKQMQRGE